MKWTRFAFLVVLALVLSSGLAFAGAGETYRQQTAASKMLHKLGRGVTNACTCWVEVPRNIAIEWEKTDPFTGFIMGAVKGAGWGFVRLTTGIYETVTFPFPVPEDYQAMLEPEFVITDIWGDPIPELTDFRSNDPKYPGNAPVYPQRFSY
jgi:putative exosortase-associated protein (TIGR04073 family)